VHERPQFPGAQPGLAEPRALTHAWDAPAPAVRPRRLRAPNLRARNDEGAPRRPTRRPLDAFVLSRLLR